jgi:hypothetical protein
MLNQGAFTALTISQKERALAGARRLGYEFSVRSATIEKQNDMLYIELSLINKGVAPFYYDWPLELAAVDGENKIKARSTTHWKPSRLLPGAAQKWSFESTSPKGNYILPVCAINPLKGGKMLRFANKTQDQNLEGWLTLAPFAS